MSNVDRVEFQGKVVLEISDVDGEWVVAREFAAKVFMDDGTAEWIFVPEGFRTDLASVPRWPGMFWLFGGKARKSAVLHDFLYRDTRRPREWCDAVFYAAMRAEEPGWRRAVMWLGVRIGGAFVRDSRPEPVQWPEA